MKRFYILVAACLLFSPACISQPFAPDPTFGFGGKAYTNVSDINKSDERANVMAIQPDGKIVIAGSTISPSAILRYNPDGTPDVSFDHDGTALCFVFTVSAIAIQSDGRILIAGSSKNDFALARFNGDGSPDKTFDGDGRLTTDMSAGVDAATSMIIQNDGKIVLAGYGDNGGNVDFAVVRYNTDGSLDNSFATAGKLFIPVGPASDMATVLFQQSDGKLIIGGQASNAVDNDFAIVRLNPNGSLDNSFDGDGKLSTDFGSVESIKYITVQPNGTIKALGLSGPSTVDLNIAVSQYNADGSPDNSFDGDGKQLIINNFQRFIYGITIQADGKIVAVGGDGNGTATYRFAISRFNTNGVLDNSFDGDGKAYMVVGPVYNFAIAVMVQSDGKIVTAGRAESTGGVWEDFALARFNADGSGDNSFGNGGNVIDNLSSSDDHARCMTVQPDGKVLVAGFSYTNITGSTINRAQFSITRFNADGTLDNSFNGTGRLTTTFPYNENHIYAITVLSDGKILLAGDAQDYPDFALMRLNADGTPDNSFGVNGLVKTQFNIRSDGARSMVVQGDGKIVLGGYIRDNLDNNANVAIARYNSDGSLDNSFNGTGLFSLAVGPGTATDLIDCMAMQPDGKILAGGYTHNGNDYDFLLLRLNPNGTLDNTFDGDGVATTDMGALHNTASSMVLQPDGKIVLAGNRQTGSVNDFALVRYNTNGSLDNTFNGTGIVITDINSGNDVLNSIVLQSNGKILAAGYSDNGTDDDFALLRYNDDGGLDNSFNGNGKALYDLEGGSNERCFAVALNGNRIYLAGEIMAAGRWDFALLALSNDLLGLGTLPLQLLEFSGKRVNDDGLLTWKTEQESNMLEYVVERSVDGRNYTAIGSVAAGNKAGISYYNFTDGNIISLNASVIYYRLREKGIDGKLTYSRIIAVPLDKNKNVVMFYPNPVVNEINVAMTTGRKEKLQVRIIDNGGRIIRQQPWDVSAGSMSLSIDVSGLASGIYYLEIKGDDTNYKKRFIK